MAGIVLPHADIALFSDPVASRVIFPRVQALPQTRRYERTVVRFEGDDQPTPFGGEGRPRSYQLQARFLSGEQATLAALIALLDLAHQAPDPRLLLRTHVALIGELNEIEVVTVDEVVTTPAGAGVFDVTFTANTVAYTIAV
jgi:hypothetical protein